MLGRSRATLPSLQPGSQSAGYSTRVLLTPLLLRCSAAVVVFLLVLLLASLRGTAVLAEVVVVAEASLLVALLKGTALLSVAVSLLVLGWGVCLPAGATGFLAACPCIRAASMEGRVYPWEGRWPSRHSRGRPAAHHCCHPGAKDTTWPMMMSAGDFNPASCTRLGSCPTSPHTVRWRLVVPRSTATAGTFEGMPCSCSCSYRLGRVCSPMYTTSVVCGSAAPATVESSSSCSPPSRAWPVRNRTLVATPLCVMGMPNSAQIPEAAVMPGTHCTFIPWLER
mmetsp:Transcript_8735/g.21926  ORF Transcript_8735/g.21926 Transcript_8735/m.21926 type:complete len:281 (+) Transcript_8735:446-1288(+)